MSDKCLECVCKTCVRRESMLCPDCDPCVSLCSDGRKVSKYHCQTCKTDPKQDMIARMNKSDAIRRMAHRMGKQV